MLPAVGDIVLYTQPSGITNRRPMFPEGQPIVLEQEDGEGFIARFVYSVTRFQVETVDLAPFPDNMTASEAALNALVPIKGRLAEVHHEQMLEGYAMLVGSGRIPPIDATKILRNQSNP